MKRLKDRLRELNVNLWEPLLPRGVSPGTAAAGNDPRASLMVELQTDVPLFYDILEALVEPQLASAGVGLDGDDGFGAAMAGDHIFAALSAFMEEWRDFFQMLRPEMATAMKKTQAWWDKAVKAAEANLADPRIDAAMNQKIDAATSSASMKMLALLESIQTDEPSVN